VPENIPIARRVRSEFDSLNNLRKQSPALFSGVCAVVLIFGSLWWHEKYWGKAQLASENADLKQQLILSEARLAPFKTVALEKYPGRWEDALSKLANDVRRFEEQLKRSENKIRSIDLEVAVEFSAVWKDGKFPDTSQWIWFNQGEGAPAVDLEFLHDDGRSLPVSFRYVKDFKIEKLGEERSRLFFRCSAEPRSSVFGLPTDEIHRCQKAGWFLVGLNSPIMEPKPIKVFKVEIEILVNSLPEWSLAFEKEAEVMPESKGVPGLEAIAVKPWNLGRPVTIKGKR
jgi:hypothetical protein